MSCKQAGQLFRRSPGFAVSGSWSKIMRMASFYEPKRQIFRHLTPLLLGRLIPGMEPPYFLFSITMPLAADAESREWHDLAHSLVCCPLNALKYCRLFFAGSLKLGQNFRPAGPPHVADRAQV